MNDLMAWNADTTRMPARMHSEYLRKLFLRNDLAEGRFVSDGSAIALRDIDVPIFSVATEMDHVAPWRSVKKLHLLTDTEITFLLTSGGHNAGIVSEPGHKGRHYLVHTSAKQDHYIDPDHWQKLAERHEGSWWPQWVEWLKARSSGETVPASERPPRPFKSDAPFIDAPGAFVLEV
jgi:polyhydroxyalkanoate synthase